MGDIEDFALRWMREASHLIHYMGVDSLAARRLCGRFGECRIAAEFEVK